MIPKDRIPDIIEILYNSGRVTTRYLARSFDLPVKEVEEMLGTKEYLNVDPHIMQLAKDSLSHAETMCTIYTVSAWDRFFTPPNSEQHWAIICHATITESNTIAFAFDTIYFVAGDGKTILVPTDFDNKFQQLLLNTGKSIFEQNFSVETFSNSLFDPGIAKRIYKDTK